MKTYLISLILFLFAIPVFCQYGNMCVIEPCDFQFTSCKNINEEGQLHVIGENYIGFFVDVSKDSKVKITFSGKGVENKNYFPNVKVLCDNSYKVFNMMEPGFYDYAVNFDLKKGVHFLKIENMPFPKHHTYSKRELFIKRVYISGNSCTYIKNPTEKNIIDSAFNFVENNMQTFTVFKKNTPSVKKICFDYGILVNNKDLNDENIKELKHTYNLIINEENEEFSNKVSDYTLLYVNDDTDVSFISNQIYEFLSNGVKLNYILLDYDGDSIKNLWNVLNIISVYNIPIQLYNLKNYKNLNDYINISLPFVKGIVFSEETKAPKLETLPIFTPKYIDKKSGKYEYKAFPGEYIFNGNVVIVK